MKKVSKIITATVFAGLAVVAASCAKSGGGGGECTKSAKYNFELWTGFGNDYSDEVDAIVASYNDLHCGDIKIKHTSKSSYDQLRSEVINTSSDTRKLPNITCGYPDHFADYNYLNFLEPLDPYIERYNMEHGGDIISDYFEDYMKENKEIAYDESGKALTVGIPFNKSTEVMLCNGYYFDYFKERLATTEGYTLEVPTTWEKLGEIGVKLRSIVDLDQLESTSKTLSLEKLVLMGMLPNVEPLLPKPMLLKERLFFKISNN